MQIHIRLAIEALLKIDTTVTLAERRRLLLSEDANPRPLDRILSRTEASDRFGCCTRTLDNWANRGLLRKWKLPGLSRATGYRESEVAALLDAGVNTRGGLGPAKEPVVAGE